MKKAWLSLGIAAILVAGGCSNETSGEKKTEGNPTEKIENQDEKMSKESTVSNEELNSEKAKEKAQTSEVKIDTKTLAKENDGMVIDIDIPEISGMKNEQKQKELNDRFLELGNALDEETRSSEEGLKELEGMELHAEGIMSYEVKMLNEEVLSLIIDQYIYSGGAHGITSKSTFNIELETGKELYLADIFTSENYMEDASIQVRDFVENSEIKQFFFEEFKTIKPNEKFYLTEDHVVLVFDMYDYTAGAAGSPEIEIEKNNLPSLKETYK